ncbi:twin-arginine translocase TatA/TatE family subunit [Raineyella fluvialis]|uniref:Sec-independent protein translocase protein TatA n=1 Tax=Raineyella fluvialis TaxID=2662261 RepID=A0A5Q2FJL3_9ACTN|nr:twin-arginine translocase TatA/TatE family subunit [Raineyella fluvialis]QGF24845.1 twin-arginine translocase TatA/TatE family subunit [Raineyella fluvialis]
MLPLSLAGLGGPELLIILAIVLLMFGGSRLAGLGKSTGRAIREFKDETKDLRRDPQAVGTTEPTPTPAADEAKRTTEVHDAEIVDPEHKKDH